MPLQINTGRMFRKLSIDDKLKEEEKERNTVNNNCYCILHIREDTVVKYNKIVDKVAFPNEEMH